MIFYLSLPYSRQVPKSKEIFLLIFTVHSAAHLNSQESLKPFCWLVNSAETRDIQRQSRDFPSSQFSQILCLALFLSYFSPKYNMAKFHSFSIVGIFKASQVGSILLGTFSTAAFLGNRNAVIKDFQSLLFLFCKI